MKEPTSDASILIVLMGSIGDVTRGLAVASALRKNLPQVRITWLVEPKCAPLVRLHKGIDEVLVFEREAPLKGVLRLISDLKARKFDICLDMQRHFKSGVFSLLSRAPRRIGFHKLDSKEGNFLFNNEHIPYCGNSLNKFDHYLKFVEYLGIELDEERSAFLPEWGKCHPERSEGSQGIEVSEFKCRHNVGIVLGSSWESKDWPESHYKELIDRVLEVKDTGIVLLGDSATRSVAAGLSAAFQDRCITDKTGKMSLEELVSTIRGLDCCVGPDSGPGHIAAAVGTPYVALFGPTSPVRTAPRGRDVEVLSVEVPCGPCYRRNCPGLGKVCMTRIEPERVFERLRRFLED